MPACPVYPYLTLSFRYLFLSLSLSLSLSAGLLALTIFIHVSLSFFSYYFYRLMILFLVSSFSYCMAETRSCAAGTHSSQEHSPRLPDAPSTSGTPCSLNHSPRLPYHFHPNFFGVLSCSSFRESMLACKPTVNIVARGQRIFLLLVHEKK